MAPSLLDCWNNLRATLRHKWFVFLEYRRAGMPWRGIVHDWDKLLPGTFLAYTRHFYTDGYIRGRPHVPGADPAFDQAWLSHQKRSKHHWEYWVLILTQGQTVALPIPPRHRIAMLCDWRGAGRGYDNGNPDTRAWYKENRDEIELHPTTRAWIDQELDLC